MTYEIDFVVNANRAGEKYYIQSALRLDDKTKRHYKNYDAGVDGRIWHPTYGDL